MWYNVPSRGCLKCVGKFVLRSGELILFKIMIEKMFTFPCVHKPQHMIYDSNCNALREVESREIAFFEGMGMCVDAFHHKTKHKASDSFCRERCDMKIYPELLDDIG